MKVIVKKIHLIIIILLMSFLMVNFCLAAGFIKPDVTNEINKHSLGAGETAGYITFADEGGILSLIQIVISAFLSILGTIFLIYMLYAGYNWMTAQGEEEKVTKAKDTLKRAIVGIIIVIAAYAISVFIISALEPNLQGGQSTGSQPPPAGPGPGQEAI